MKRLFSIGWPAVLAAVVLSGCGTPAPPARLYQLRLDTPMPAQQPASATAATTVWEIGGDLRVPAYLDRETVVLARGDSGLQLLEGHRWAEPLRDTVPRLLQSDLATLRGADKVWAAPAPAGVVVKRRLRVELLSLQADAARSSVTLQARWQLLDAQGQAAPLLGQAALQVPTASSSIDDIALAHRLALWRLAERIAATAP